MKHRVLASVGCAAAIAFAQPVSYLAQEAGKAADILARARQSIGGRAIDTLKTFSLQSTVQRNLGSMQFSSDVEIYVELPDKYARVENMSGGPGMVVAGGGTTGFNGDRPLQKAGQSGLTGGGMVIRMGTGGTFAGGGPTEKPTPEQLEQMNKTALRSSRIEASRLMLGWFAMAHPAANADYAYLGEAESNEGKAWVIAVKNEDGLAARLFVDEQTNLPLMVTYKAPQPRVVTTSASPSKGDPHVITKGDVDKQVQDLQRQEPVMADFTLYFEDWRDADGLQFPFKVRRAMGGTTTEEWTVSRIKVNPKIDARRFAVDSGS
jgi:hypothetical protein